MSSKYPSKQEQLSHLRAMRQTWEFEIERISEQPKVNFEVSRSTVKKNVGAHQLSTATETRF
jgi:hypothetical protein